MAPKRGSHLSTNNKIDIVMFSLFKYAFPFFVSFLYYFFFLSFFLSSFLVSLLSLCLSLSLSIYPSVCLSVCLCFFLCFVLCYFYFAGQLEAGAEIVFFVVLKYWRWKMRTMPVKKHFKRRRENTPWLTMTDEGKLGRKLGHSHIRHLVTDITLFDFFFY